MQPNHAMPFLRKYPRPKTIACDVDGTLKRRSGEANRAIVAWLEGKKADGYTLTLWSMRGAEYAKDFAESVGLTSLFDSIIGKPGYVIDDQGLMWTKECKVMRPSDFEDEQDAT